MFIPRIVCVGMQTSWIICVNNEIYFTAYLCFTIQFKFRKKHLKKLKYHSIYLKKSKTKQMLHKKKSLAHVHEIY